MDKKIVYFWRNNEETNNHQPLFTGYIAYLL